MERIKSYSYFIAMVIASVLIVWGGANLKLNVLSSSKSEYQEFYEKKTQKEYLTEEEFEELLTKQNEYHESTRQEGGLSLNLFGVSSMIWLLLVVNFLIFRGWKLSKFTITGYLAFLLITSAILISLSFSLIVVCSLLIISFTINRYQRTENRNK